MEIYVYDLVDPRSGKAFYVGKGQKRRAWQHVREARNGGSGAKCERIREIEGDGAAVGVRIVQRFAREIDALRFEAKRISELGGLTNILGGGGPILPKPERDFQVAVDHLRCYKWWADRGKVDGVLIAGVWLDLAAIAARWLDPVSDYVSEYGETRIVAAAADIGIELRLVGP